MKSLIEYLCLFAVLLVFSPNNYVTLIYLVSNIIFLTIYFILGKYIKKKKSLEEEKIEIDNSKVLLLLMLILINLIGNFATLNIIFGFIVLLVYVIHFIVSYLKKDYLIKKQILDLKYIFDIYSVLCIIDLLLRVIRYEF